MFGIFDCKRTGCYMLISAVLVCVLHSPAFSADVSSKISVSYRTENQIGYKVIHYGKGTFILPQGLKIPSNTIVEGEGKDTKLIPMPKISGYAQFVTNSDHINGNENIVIRNLSIDFNLPSLKGDAPGIVRFRAVTNLVLSNIWMDVNSNLYAIDLSGACRNALISSCSISNNGNGGCLMVRNQDKSAEKSSFSIHIQNNAFTSGSRDEALAVFGWLGNVYDVLISNNLISAKTASFGICAYGIDKLGDTGRLSNVVIEGNTIAGGKNAGVAVKGGATQVKVESNSILSPYQDGVFIHTGGDNLPVASYITVSKNTIKDAGRHGIYTSGFDLSVNENVIVNCKMCGIFVGDNVQVLRNSIYQASPGILVAGTRNRTVRYNVLHGSAILVLNNDWLNISDNI